MNYHNPAKQYLQRYRAARAQYASLCREINDLRESLTGTTVQLRSDVVSGSGPSDRMADTVAKIADMEASISGEADKVSAALDGVLAAIRSVPDQTQRTVLTLRYVEGLDWISVQERVGYERTQVYVIHGRALVAVNEWLRGQTHAIDP